MDALLRQSEELLSLKLMADRHLEDTQDLTRLFGQWDRQWSKIYPVICEFRRLQEKKDRQGLERRPEDIRYSKLLEFGELTHDHMKALERKLAELGRTADHHRYATGLMVDNLLGDVKKNPDAALLDTVRGLPETLAGPVPRPGQGGGP